MFRGLNSGFFEKLEKYNFDFRNFLFFFFRDSIRRSIYIYWLLINFSISTLTRQSPGFYFSSQNLKWLPIQFFLIWVVTLLTPRICKRPLDTLQIFMLIFLTIPSIAISFNNVLVPEISTNILTLIYVFMTQILIKLLSDSFEKRTFIKIRNDILHVRPLILFFVISFFVFIYTAFIFKEYFNLVTFDQIYTARANFARNFSNFDFLPTYSLGWFSGIVTPFMLLIAIFLRSYVLVALSGLIGIFIYGVVSQKWVLASFFLIFFLILVGRLLVSAKHSARIIFSSFNFFILGSLSLSSILNSVSFADLTIRRVLIDPAIMFQYYVKFSLNYPLSWWSDSKIFSFFRDTSEQSVSKIIGERYFNVPETMFLKRGPSANATTGTIGDSIGQGGFLGLLLATFCLFVFFKILQDLADTKNFIFVFVISGFCVALLNEGTLHTLTLSRGLFAVPLILIALPRDREIRD